MEKKRINKSGTACMCCWRASSHRFFGFLEKEDHAVHAMNEVHATLLRTTH